MVAAQLPERMQSSNPLLIETVAHLLKVWIQEMQEQSWKVAAHSISWKRKNVRARAALQTDMVIGKLKNDDSYKRRYIWVS